MKFALYVLIFLSITLKSVTSYNVRYDNYKVYRFVPKNENEVNILRSLETENPGFSVWKGVADIGQEVDFMIPPHLQHEIITNLGAEGIGATIFVEDVQRLIDEETQAMISAGNSSRMTWTSYHSTQVIHTFLSQQAAAKPNMAQVVTIGKSYEGRDLKLIKISKPGNTNRPIIWVDANIHAREWITNAVCTYLINELLNSNNANIVKLTDDFDFYIIPVLNPDGYEYSRTSDRMWRKTRSRSGTSTCRGADPNRNWGYRWNTGGSSTNPCSETYCGSAAFSETENRQTSQYMQTIGSRMIFYLSLHSYSQMILLPYGHTASYTEKAEYMRVGRLAANALATRYGTRFTVGSIVELLYVATGGSMDYAKVTFNTKLAYTYEMRDKGAYGFVLPPSQIVPSSLEFMDSLIAIAAQLRQYL